MTPLMTTLFARIPEDRKQSSYDNLLKVSLLVHQVGGNAVKPY